MGRIPTRRISAILHRNAGCQNTLRFFFKEILNPDTVPSRLEELLSLILQWHIRILHVLPNDSSRIAEENALLIMDIVVQLEDGSIANIEVQK